MFCGFLSAVKPCAKCTETHKWESLIVEQESLWVNQVYFHLRSRRDVTASVCVRACACACVCVYVCALREDVNVVMNQEKTLVISAIDCNHLMILMC